MKAPRPRQHGIPLIVCGLAALLATLAGHALTNDSRPESWAQPIKGLPGLSNLHGVSDQLYRGAQPEDEGFVELARLGVKTVVNLRTFHSDRDECDQAGLRYVHISMQAWEPEDDEVVEFLRVVTDPENQPVFVHCLHGADRTGLMTAIYRIAIEGWSKDEAILEMTEGGFGFHGVWKNLVEYVRECDVERLMVQAGAGQPGDHEAPPPEADQ